MGHDYCHRHGCMCYGGCPDCNPNSKEGQAIDRAIPADQLLVVSFEYLNHNGVKSIRSVKLDAIEFIPTVNFGYQPGWFLSGFCLTKKARRSFALSHIVFPDQSPMNRIFTLKLGEKRGTQDT